jgi:hypothetical protein
VSGRDTFHACSLSCSFLSTLIVGFVDVFHDCGGWDYTTIIYIIFRGFLHFCLQFLVDESLLIFIVSIFFAEIYQIVSQKQIQDGPGEESPSNQVRTIHVEPTDPAAMNAQRKKCCAP